MSFLDGFFKSGGGGGGMSPLLDFGMQLASLFGPNKQVLDSRDFQATQDQADVNNTNQVRRQNEFLRGVTPTNIEQYNAYQDGTYAEDSARQGQRIMDVSKATGMSPWELNGGSAATPLPAYGGSGGTQAPNFMASVVPMATAALQAKTQLATARMNNDTALQINDQNTAGGQLPKMSVEKVRQDIAASLQGMSESKSRQTVMAADIVLKGAQTAATNATTKKTGEEILNLGTQRRFLGQQIEESKARTTNIGQQTEESKARTTNIGQQTANLAQDYNVTTLRMQLMKNEDFRNSILTLAKVAPTETWYQPGGSTTQVMDGGALAKLARNLTVFSGSQSGQINDATVLDEMTDLELSAAMKAAAAISQTVKDIADVGAKGTKSLLDNAKRLTPSEY